MVYIYKMIYRSCTSK